MASDLNDEEFRNELVELFLLEAEEWLQQTRAALEQLEQARDGAAHGKLLDLMQQALSNLGGSAATVELPKIEGLAFEVLPHLDSLRARAGAAAAAPLAPIRDGLDRLARALAEMGDDAADEVEEDGVAEDTEEPEGAFADTPAVVSQISLDALRHVQAELAQAGRPSRNLVELVIERARDLDEGQGDHVDTAAVTRALRELEGLDEHFLAEAQRRMPDITRSVARLKTLAESDIDLNDALGPVLRSVHALRESAEQARAAGIIQFLQGLSTFLTLVTERGVWLVLGRIDAVEFRLGAVIPMVQQWVEVGRIEREAIGSALSG